MSQTMVEETEKTRAGSAALSIRDGRTGKTYEVPIENGVVRASELKKISAPADGPLMVYDPAYMSTASCRSSITFIDGDKGILRYRGYPIEELAERCTFLDVAYLLLHGELPDAEQRAAWTHEITFHTMLHESIKKFMDGFSYTAHPMGMLVATVGALSTFYPEASDIHDPENRRRQIYRLVAKMPTLAAFAFRHSRGLPYAYPDNELTYPENFLNMMFKMTEVRYHANPVFARALDVLFILHADHEQNCSTSVMRAIGSSHADPYSAVAGACAALYGPLHGGANEAVLRMLQEIGDKKNVPAFLKDVRAGHGEKRLMGFGHRIYKNYDPRAKIIKRIADEVLAEAGRTPLLDIALELERIALEDDYFVQRKLYPNVDFYSGIIYQALGIPTSMFTVLFAIARTIGWLAQWEEMLGDPEQKIARPRQVYVGASERHLAAARAK